MNRMNRNEPDRTGPLAAAVGEARRRVNISRLDTLKGQTCVPYVPAPPPPETICLRLTLGKVKRVT